VGGGEDAVSPEGDFFFFNIKCVYSRTCTSMMDDKDQTYFIQWPGEAPLEMGVSRLITDLVL
jgi:hypothetical protein